MSLSFMIILLGMISGLTFIAFIIIESLNYRKRVALQSLSVHLNSSKAPSTDIVKKRDQYLRGLFSLFVSLFANLLTQLNVVKKQLNILRSKALKAGIRSKTAPELLLLIKLVIAIAVASGFLLTVSPNAVPSYSYIPLFLAVLFFGYSVPDLYLINEWQKRSSEVFKNWSDFIDVILVSVSSGQTIEAGIRRASFEMANTSPELSKEFMITVTELSLLDSRRRAYERLGDRLPLPFVDNFIFDVVQSETIGTPIIDALTKIAEDNRSEKTQRVEKKAAALGPKLTVPMIVFFFPILFVVVLVPAFI